MTVLLDEFRAHVDATPDAPALVVGDELLTYRQLDRASAALAGRLAAAGAVPGTVVCVHLPQCAGSFVAMLATLRAGASWAVVEPSQPPGRLAALLRDTDCRVTLHDAAGAASLRSHLDTAPVDRHPAMLDIGAAGPAPDPVSRVDVPDGLPAYVIYTSGSTGRPKGVLVSRAQLAASVRCREWLYGPEPPAFLDPLRFSFDGSLAVAFWALTRGGSVLVPAEHQLPDPAAVAALAAAHRATHLIAVPSFYRRLLDRAAELPATLRLAVVGGEPCTAELVAAHRATLPAVELVNEYGPTETVVSCTAHRVRDVPAAVAPIGRPHPGATVHVLDEKLRPQPAGAVGELYVGGTFPATGYARQPARTAERFVADPSADRPGARLYRTGDLVCWNRDGELEFRGRADDQIKVRGHRIELGEIARVLEHHPMVARAEVIPVMRDAEPQLVAFLVHAGPAPSGAELREFCRGRLLEAAVPARFVAVDAMPLGRTGKVDRTALAARVARRPAPADVDGAAGEHWNGVQRAVWSAWRRVLGHGDIGLADSFFDQGGTSLKLIDLHHRFEAEWPGAVRVGELFDLTTIEAQARAIGERTGERNADRPRQRLVSYEL